MNNREAVHVTDAVRRFEAAAERWRNRALAIGKEQLGRNPTALELESLAELAKAKEAALRGICTFPSADFAALRTKAKLLHGILMGGETLRADNQKALLQSIMQMVRNTET